MIDWICFKDIFVASRGPKFFNKLILLLVEPVVDRLRVSNSRFNWESFRDDNLSINFCLSTKSFKFISCLWFSGIISSIEKFLLKMNLIILINILW